MDKCLISVIIPIYNVEPYIERCINSVLVQTYTDLEIILVDDGSTDRSGELCDRYALKDQRIKTLHQPNQGLAGARNSGIAVSSGSLITFLDGDDWFAKDAIENLYAVMCRENAQISCCLIKTLDEYEASEGRDNQREIEMVGYSCSDGLKKMLQQSEITCSACAKLYKRELFENIKYPEGKLFEDLGTTYKIFSKADKIALVRRVGYFYYTRPGSIQHSTFDTRKLIELQFAKEQKAFLDKRFPELQQATTERLVSVCFHMLFSMEENEEFQREQQELIEIIKKNRCSLAFGKGTGRKVRFGCLASFFGIAVTKRFYTVMRIRGRINK